MTTTTANRPANLPVVRVDLELGTYAPTVDPDDPEWAPITYAVHAHHASTLSDDATTVVARRLERLTLTLTNDEPDVEEAKPAELELPLTLEGLEALSAIIDHARDYLAGELGP